MAAINKILRGRQQAATEEPSQPAQSNEHQWCTEYNAETWVENSMAVWPNDPQLKRDINLPLSLSMRPFEAVEVTPSLIQLQDAGFSPESILTYRCFSCKAFINKLCALRSERTAVASFR